jgi:pilus assembly protein CpaB
MERRRILIIAAAIVAALGIILVLLYVKGADNRADDKYKTVNVLVATAQISKGESIEDATNAGKLTLRPVTQADLLPNYQVTTTSLANEFALQTIYPGEQIIASKFGAQQSTDNNSPLPIPANMQAVSINLTDPERVAGFVEPGSQVAIYYSSGAQVRLMLNRVTIIGVGSTTPVVATNDPSATTTTAPTEALPATLMTLALSQKDAQKIIFAQGQGTVFFGLLTTKSQVDLSVPATTLANLFN